MKEPVRRPGGFRPNSKRQLLFATVALVAVVGGYGVAQWLGPEADVAPTPAAPEQSAAKPWYQDRPPPPRMVEVPDMPLLPEPDAHPVPPVSAAAPLAYEESLPGNVYEAASVEPGGSDGAPSAPASQQAPSAPQAAAVAPAPVSPTTEQPGAGARLAWLRNAVPVPAGAGAMIAVVIDDMGLDHKRTERILDLPPPLTVSYLTYARHLDRQAALARAAGHEVMVHVAMEPSSVKVDPGPDVLLTRQNDSELVARLEQGIGRVPGAVGINNHMGSRFTEDARAMSAVMAVLKNRGLLFLDSWTSPKTVGPEEARLAGVAFAERNVFLDNVNTREAVLKRLAETERLARKRGFAVAIGHPRDGTIRALTEWLPTAVTRGLRLVPVSAIVKHRMGLDVPVAGSSTQQAGG